MSSGVHVHEFQAFACTSCGRCCKPWEIAIEAAQLSAIQGSRSYQTRLKDSFVPIFAERPGVARLGDRGDDQCTFLDGQNLCELHSELGGRSKPLGCQLYPYQAVQTPAGMHVYLSFGCPPVVAGLDTDVESNRAQLNQALGQYSAPLQDTPDSPYAVDLSEDIAISWASYLGLEQRILAAYQPEQPVDSLIGMVFGILRAGGRGDWPELVNPQEDLTFAKEILAKYLGSMVSALEDIEDGEQRAALAKAVEGARRVTSTRFAMQLPALDLDRPHAAWMLQVYQRYFLNAVAGKSLLKSTVVGKLLAIACAIILAGYYAEAYRQARGRDAIDLDCLTDAFRIVEFHITTHSPVIGSYFVGLEETFAKLAELPIEEIA